VKDEKVYAVDMPYEFKYQKSVDMLTGEVHYPTNRMWLRGMTDEELATWIDRIQADAYERGMMETPIVDYPNIYSEWLNWLKEEAEGDTDEGN
jgi:hypothetical protein